MSNPPHNSINHHPEALLAFSVHGNNMGPSRGAGRQKIGYLQEKFVECGSGSSTDDKSELENAEEGGRETEESDRKGGVAGGETEADTSRELADAE